MNITLKKKVGNCLRVSTVTRHQPAVDGLVAPTPPYIEADQVGRLAYNTDEAAGALGISKRSLRRLEQRGLLQPSRGLRHKLYSLTDLLAYLEVSK